MRRTCLLILVGSDCDAEFSVGAQSSVSTPIESHAPVGERPIVTAVVLPSCASRAGSLWVICSSGSGSPGTTAPSESRERSVLAASAGTPKGHARLCEGTRPALPRCSNSHVGARVRARRLDRSFEEGNCICAAVRVAKGDTNISEQNRLRCSHISDSDRSRAVSAPLIGRAPYSSALQRGAGRARLRVPVLVRVDRRSWRGHTLARLRDHHASARLSVEYRRQFGQCDRRRQVRRGRVSRARERLLRGN